MPLKNLSSLFFLSTALLFSLEFDYHLKPKKVTKNLYCFFGSLENISKHNGGNMVNSCYVQTKEGFVVIDSGPTFAYASQSYEAMQKIKKLPVKYVINTHIHDDHWLGNSFYKDKGTKLIGPKNYVQEIVPKMQTRMERILGKALFGQTKIVPLDKVVEENLSLALGDTKFEIRQVEPIAHTKGDLIVYIASQKILFVGDLIFNGRITSLRDGSLLGSLKAVEKIDAYDAKVIITGHGYQTDANSTHEFKAYLSGIKREVLKAQEADIGMEKITKIVTMPHFKTLKLYDVLHNRNILDAYGELELIDDE